MKLAATHYNNCQDTNCPAEIISDNVLRRELCVKDKSGEN